MNTEPDEVADPITTARESIDGVVAKAIAPDVEKEKCVVAQYKTTEEQLEKFKDLLNNCDINYIPLEWVIDIADESNGWFYGTAYHYNDSTNMLHVMVPDKLNPSFDGEISLDHRTVHLVECVDGKTEGLFNKIVRDSVVKVRWEVEWFEEGTGTEKQMPDSGTSPQGRWVLSVARYYIQMANQLLVEDEDIGQDARGFVMLTADLNLRLRTCFKGKGIEDFQRLIEENIVQSSPNAIEMSRKSMVESSTSSPLPDKETAGFRRQTSNNKSSSAGGDASGGGVVTIRKLAEMSRGLRESLSDILDDRERLIGEQEKIAKAFHAFAMEGDLEMGLKLLSQSESMRPREKGDSNPAPRTKKAIEREAQQELMDSAAEDVWYLAQRIEKSSMKMLKSSDGDSGAGGGGGSKSDEIEYLRKAKAKMQREIEERDRELEYLRSKARLS
jgi:hypothetical protein